MKVLAKLGLVGAGYIGAFAMASAVVAVHIATTQGPDRRDYAAMFDFGDSLLFLGVFGLAAVPPTGAALFFLRPYPRFWRVLSSAAMVMAIEAMVFCGHFLLALTVGRAE